MIAAAPMSIARTVLREQVKDVLLERILRGELEPGERLVETRLARELGTSQAPVREALRDLELMRLVESEPFRGGDPKRAGTEARKQVRRTERVVRRRTRDARRRAPAG